MKYDFTTVLDRRGRDSIAADWIPIPGVTVREGFDAIPLWVADMSFPTAPPILEAMRRRLEFPSLGYFPLPQEYYDAIIGWQRRRNGVEGLEKEHIGYENGVLGGVSAAIRMLTAPGEEILLHAPTYVGFTHVLKNVGRVAVHSDLKPDEIGIWRMDYEDMERAFRDEGIRFMLLCNPHNPVGRVWRREELQKAVDIANRYGVIVLCDEIHGEFALDRKLTRVYSLDNVDNVVSFNAPTKAFNIAGLRTSTVIVRNPELREKIAHVIGLSHAGPNIFGMVAQRAAFEHGDEWMDAVLEYIRENRDYAVEYIEKNIPKIKTCAQEGTYVMWLDCTAMGLDDAALMRRFVDVGGVGMSQGTSFGEEGKGHMRLNIATQRRNLIAALEGLRRAADL
jgi:cystathionine beta-lyase